MVIDYDMPKSIATYRNHYTYHVAIYLYMTDLKITRS
jgi:hypothetical protein